MKQIENTLQDLKCMLIEDGYTEANIVLRTLIKAQEQVKNCSIPDVSVSNLPTEDEIIETILNCVDIRGIELEYYRREFTDDRSGLITALNKIYSR